jgi:hypothetical protein
LSVDKVLMGGPEPAEAVSPHTEFFRYNASPNAAVYGFAPVAVSSLPVIMSRRLGFELLTKKAGTIPEFVMECNSWCRLD